jgi:phage repressor protein C with HTH and peptisase S24 domain
MSTDETKKLSLESIIGRIKELENIEKPADIARAIGISGSLLSNWTKRGTIPYAQLFSYARNNGISFEWLLTGESSIIKEEPENYNTNNDFEAIPLHKVGASAGKGVGIDDDYDMSTLLFPKLWFEKRHLNAANLLAVDVAGDSMEPLIPDGSVVLVDKTQTNLSNGNVYLFQMDDDLLIKRIVRDDQGYLAVSINNSYPNMRINEVNTKHVIGQVMRALPDIKL